MKIALFIIGIVTLLVVSRYYWLNDLIRGMYPFRLFLATNVLFSYTFYIAWEELYKRAFIGQNWKRDIVLYGAIFAIVENVVYIIRWGMAGDSLTSILLGTLARMTISLPAHILFLYLTVRFIPLGILAHGTFNYLLDFLGKGTWGYIAFTSALTGITCGIIYLLFNSNLMDGERREFTVKYSIGKFPDDPNAIIKEEKKIARTKDAAVGQIVMAIRSTVVFEILKITNEQGEEVNEF